MNRPAAFVGLVLLLAAAGCGGESKNGGPVAAPDSVSLVFAGSEWAEILGWDFSDGYYPEGWGWGKWRVADGILTGEDPEGRGVVYVLPVAHEDNVLIETRVRLVRGREGYDAEVHLLTRDGGAAHNESGMALTAGSDTLDVLHVTDARRHVVARAPLARPRGYGEWVIMRFVMRGGVIDAYLDDDLVFTSLGSDTSGAMTRLPVGTYFEPNIAVRNGVARFDHVRVYAMPSAPLPAAPTAARVGGRDPDRHWFVDVMLLFLYIVIFIVCAYAIRHYVFTINRMFGRQRRPYLDVDAAEWPPVTVLVPAHNEEIVIAELLEALLDVDYPQDRLTIMPINDRSSDATGRIIDEFAARNTGRVVPFHRSRGKGGKAAALNDALEHVATDVVLVFDADYVPGRGLIRQLVAPFFDPEVGAVMGRVVPYNVGSNLLTRLLDLERAGGYQVDQQARMNMKMVPQYGGTVGGVRRQALLAVGGWRDDSLAEDTDATYRLLAGGWKTAYQNRSECYEQVPESWASRIRQIMRWAKGHNQATARYAMSLLRNRRTRVIERIDGFLLLGVYLLPPVLLFGWLLGIVLWYLGEPRAGLIAILAVTSYSTLGNFAVFFEIAAAARLDGSRRRIRLLPFVFLGFLVSLFSVTRSLFAEIALNGNGSGGGDVVWDKTERNGTFNGHMNGASSERGGKR